MWTVFDVLFSFWALVSALLFMVSVVGHMSCSTRRRQFRKMPISMSIAVLYTCAGWPKFFIIDICRDIYQARKSRRRPPR